MKSKKPKIVFILSHPIQYFSPMMAGLASVWGDRFEVWYCSDVGLKSHHDSGFGVKYQWDIPLLDGYKSRFFKNFSPRPSVSGFSGLFNPGLILHLIKTRPEILIIHGWGYPTHLLAIFAAWFTGTKIWLRAETPLNQEEMKTGFLQKFKKILLKVTVFNRVSRFLFIGSRNKAFFKNFGATEDQLIFTPYAVDNNRFHCGTDAEKRDWKKENQISSDLPIILFCGKLISKKRPDLLLQASLILKSIPHVILFAGDGEMKASLEDFAMKNRLNVRFSGFKNQTELPSIYAGSDIFVLPSTHGETWGLVVNEAMAAGLPVIVSDTTGCSADLVEEGKNGFTFPDGNAEKLAEVLERLLTNSNIRASFSSESIKKIQAYSIPVIVANLTKTAGKI
ncbi:MAG: glycosyltransferase family 4 protein [Bacteroidetes bacterium]|nr:glycosyltransferase family 4 protein [Bacteroidota bacterium]